MDFVWEGVLVLRDLSFGDFGVFRIYFTFCGLGVDFWFSRDMVTGCFLEFYGL